MSKISHKFFIDVFLFLFLILCLRKLKELNELPTGMELFFVVLISLVAGQLLSFCYKKLRPQEDSV